MTPSLYQEGLGCFLEGCCRTGAWGWGDTVLEGGDPRCDSRQAGQRLSPAAAGDTDSMLLCSWGRLSLG